MNISNNDKIVEILLVEDNPGDVCLMLEAFKVDKLLHNINVVGDGVEAMAFLHREGKYIEVPIPDLIILDLSMPKKNGREVLAEIKKDPKLRRIPVIVFTTSQAEQDVLRCYDLHANCYITKPVDFDRFDEVFRSIKEFWHGIVKLPRSERNE